MASWRVVWSLPVEEYERPRPFQPGDVVHAEGASGILGDVIAVDERGWQVTVRWRVTETTESPADLTLVGQPSPVKWNRNGIRMGGGTV